MVVAIDYSKMADIYDIIARFDDDLRFFVEACTRVDGTALELMAGTGRVSIPVLEAGGRLVCVDGSEEMLSVLERKLEERKLTATLIRQDVRELRLGKTYPLAFMPFHSFAELVEEEDQHQALDSIYRCISPGGCFICTLHNPVVRLRSITARESSLGRFPMPGGGEIGFTTELTHDSGSGVVEGSQVFDIVDTTGKRRERREMTIRFVLIERDVFDERSRAHGFEVDALFGDYRGSAFDPKASPYMIWTLRKPATHGEPVI